IAIILVSLTILSVALSAKIENQMEESSSSTVELKNLSELQGPAHKKASHGHKKASHGHKKHGKATKHSKGRRCPPSCHKLKKIVAKHVKKANHHKKAAKKVGHKKFLESDKKKPSAKKAQHKKAQKKHAAKAKKAARKLKRSGCCLPKSLKKAVKKAAKGAKGKGKGNGGKKF
ncbi:hypothetical protein GW820_06470, partial [archaeon]|nr:hypothetical protein [archaeon]